MNAVVFEAAAAEVADRELEALLHAVYVEGGFTRSEDASAALAAEAVRARGRLFFVRRESCLAGMAILVEPSSPARRIAERDEAELQLMAVSASYRGSGVGAALLEAVMSAARVGGYRAMVLWTQPTMLAAHRLYERAGFLRARTRDFTRADGTPFWVYEAAL